MFTIATFFQNFFCINEKFVFFGIVLSQELFFNLTKIFVSRLFKMAANQTDCCWLEQRSVIKFLVVKKYKSCEISRRMCVQNREAYFDQKKMFTNV